MLFVIFHESNLLVTFHLLPCIFRQLKIYIDIEHIFREREIVYKCLLGRNRTTKRCSHNWCYACILSVKFLSISLTHNTFPDTLCSEYNFRTIYKRLTVFKIALFIKCSIVHKNAALIKMLHVNRAHIPWCERQTS